MPCCQMIFVERDSGFDFTRHLSPGAVANASRRQGPTSSSIERRRPGPPPEPGLAMRGRNRATSGKPVLDPLQNRAWLCPSRSSTAAMMVGLVNGALRINCLPADEPLYWNNQAITAARQHLTRIPRMEHKSVGSDVRFIYYNQ